MRFRDHRVTMTKNVIPTPEQMEAAALLPLEMRPTLRMIAPSDLNPNAFRPVMNRVSRRGTRGRRPRLTPYVKGVALPEYFKPWKTKPRPQHYDVTEDGKVVAS